MSSIEQMSIQGIRSFGPNASEIQLIKFFKPLTLILGPNGSGKTTIIECLNYLTTGDMPPGSGKGSVFVHDPKIARELEVKGQVRLQIKDMNGNKMVIQRSMKSTQKAKRNEFQTLDGVITRWKSNGDKISISSRCAEIDKEMINALGVSKSILNNVIFCHQEDSLWPLSEGKLLKQKFDNIFAATKYIKALNAINDIKKNQKNEIKVYLAEMKYLKENKDLTEELEENLNRTEKRYEISREKMEQIEIDLPAIKEKLNNCAEKRDKLNSSKGQISKIKNEISQLTDTIKTISTKLSTLEYFIFDESSGNVIDSLLRTDISENLDRSVKLKVLLARAEKYLVEHETSLLLNSEQMKSLEYQSTSIDEDKRVLETQISDLKILKMDYDKAGHNIIELISRLCTFGEDLAKLELLSDQTSISLRKSSLEALKNMIRNKEETDSPFPYTPVIKKSMDICDLLSKEVSNAIKVLENESLLEIEKLDVRLNKEKLNIDRVRGEKSNIEAEYHTYQIQLETTEKDLSSLKSQLSSLHSCQVKVDEIEKDIKKTEFELKREIGGENFNSFLINDPNTENDNTMKSSSKIEMDSSSTSTTPAASTEVKLRREICDLQSQRAKLMAQINLLNSEFTKLHELTDQEAKIKLFSAEIHSKKDEINILLDSKLKGWQNVIDFKIPAPDITTADGKTLEIQKLLEDFLKFDHAKKSNDLQSGIKVLDNELSTLLAEKRHVSLKLKEYVKSLDESGIESTGSEEGSKYREIEKSLHEQIERKGGLIGSQTIYLKFIKKLKNEKSCPICYRSYKNDRSKEDELNKLIEELEKKLNIIPPKLNETDELIENYRKLFYESFSTNNNSSKLALNNKIKMEDIPKCEKELDVLNGKIPQIEAKLESNRLKLKNMNSVETKIRETLKFAVIHDKIQADICDLEGKIRSEREKLPGGDGEDNDNRGSRDLMTVVEEKEEADMRLESLNRELEFKKTKLSNHVERIHKLQRQINRLESEKLKIQSTFTSKNQLETRKTELVGVLESTRSQIKTHKERIGPFLIRLDELEKVHVTSCNEKEALQKEFWFKLERVRTLRDTIESSFKQPIRCLNESFTAKFGDKENKMTETDVKIRQLNEKILCLNSEKDELTSKIEVNKNVAVNAKVKERDLNDSIHCIKWCLEIDDKRFLSRELAESVKSYAVDEAAFQDLLRKREKMEADRNQLNGMATELLREIARLKATLRADTYRLSKEKYKEYLIKYRTTQLALKDLTIYHKAFDRAIMTFHTLKMNEINKIIRQLWIQTYRGNDIDYIEIRSDMAGEEGLLHGSSNIPNILDEDSDPDFNVNQESSNSRGFGPARRGGRGGRKAGGPAASKRAKMASDSSVTEKAAAIYLDGASSGGAQRAVYNYRVVMVKDRIELDMRNRCSAGQKVLASIIIRLALAETFCLNCGILALDEPTTNLDQENIESLALALIQIINDRSLQKNFQLIIITHDEDFINLLGKSDCVDNYYRVDKNIEGFSNITKINIRA